MARASSKPTPTKKRARAGERSSVQGKASPRAKKTASAKPRAPRSTQRSAVTRDKAPRKKRASPDPAPRRASPKPPVPVQQSPRAASIGAFEPTPPRISPHTDFEPESQGHVMELHWGDDAPQSRRSSLVERWVKRGDALLRHLAEHGAARHEYRTDLREGRFVWVDSGGRVSAEARAQVLCSWSRSTSALAMAWADPLVRGAGIARLDGMPAEQDDVDEEAAWRVAMEAADRVGAEYLYRVMTPHAWYFLALSSLTFHPQRVSFTPSNPVGLVQRGLAEIHRAVESRAEPADVLRDRLSGLGQALLLESRYAYRGTDWVARLERTGRRLVNLGEQLPRGSFGSIAAGKTATEWLDRDAILSLTEALTLLEDEWALFA